MLRITGSFFSHGARNKPKVAQLRLSVFSKKNLMPQMAGGSVARVVFDVLDIEEVLAQFSSVIKSGDL
jgi:hypothetical protein